MTAFSEHPRPQGASCAPRGVCAVGLPAALALARRGGAALVSSVAAGPGAAGRLTLLLSSSVNCQALSARFARVMGVLLLCRLFGTLGNSSK